MGTSVSKSIAITAFLVGLVGTALAVYHLDVELAVAWLIVASISGLVLLKYRSDAHPEVAPERRLSLLAPRL